MNAVGTSIVCPPELGMNGEVGDGGKGGSDKDHTHPLYYVWFFSVPSLGTS